MHQSILTGRSDYFGIPLLLDRCRLTNSVEIFCASRTPRTPRDAGVRTLPPAIASMTDLGRCCRKRILRICPSNFDSRRASNAQDRFKKSAPTFRLLRAASIPSTFSTASTQSGHSAEAIYSIIIGLLCTSRQRQWPYRSFCSQSDDCRPSGNWVSSNAVRVGLSHSRAHEGGQLQVAVGRT